MGFARAPPAAAEVSLGVRENGKFGPKAAANGNGPLALLERVRKWVMVSFHNFSPKGTILERKEKVDEPSRAGQIGEKIAVQCI